MHAGLETEYLFDQNIKNPNMITALVPFEDSHKRSTSIKKLNSEYNTNKATGKADFGPIMSESPNLNKKSERNSPNEIIVISGKGVMLQPKILTTESIGSSIQNPTKTVSQEPDFDLEIQPVISQSEAKIDIDKILPSKLAPFYLCDSEWENFNNTHEYNEIENIDGNISSKNIPIPEKIENSYRNLNESNLDKSVKFLGDLRRERANSMEISEFCSPNHAPLLSRRRSSRSFYRPASHQLLIPPLPPWKPKRNFPQNYEVISKESIEESIIEKSPDFLMNPSLTISLESSRDIISEKDSFDTLRLKLPRKKTEIYKINKSEESSRIIDEDEENKSSYDEIMENQALIKDESPKEEVESSKELLDAVEKIMCSEKVTGALRDPSSKKTLPPLHLKKSSYGRKNKLNSSYELDKKSIIIENNESPKSAHSASSLDTEEVNICITQRTDLNRSSDEILQKTKRKNDDNLKEKNKAVIKPEKEREQSTLNWSKKVPNIKPKFEKPESLTVEVVVEKKNNIFERKIEFEDEIMPEIIKSPKNPEETVKMEKNVEESKEKTISATQKINMSQIYTKILSKELEDDIEIHFSSNSSSQQIETHQNFEPKLLTDISQGNKIVPISFEEALKVFQSLDLKPQFSSKNMWTSQYTIRNIFTCCFRGSEELNDEEKELCEKTIAFSEVKFNSNNSYHLNLLHSYYSKVTGNNDWPENPENWGEVGLGPQFFNTNFNYDASGLCIFHLYFFATFFNISLKEMLNYSQQPPHQFPLAKYSFEVTNLVVLAVKQRKLNKLIKANKKTIETIFYFYAGAFLYWFEDYRIKGIYSCEDTNLVMKSTKKMIRNSPNEVLMIAKNAFYKS
ncbi:unnamed protein product [Blepharisma stoltei]|uniref:ELMO domain-containing protein n=1 Tax=Blepharisma stoltei TaxID=1481888 RepID=A0AAU9JP97_9CILI|nr:unnamed protein product [Blepharisma stoltei]